MVAASGYDSDVFTAIQMAISFENSSWATGSVLQDEFYNLANNTSPAQLGTPIKLQQAADVSLFAFPPSVAISRFIYWSADFNGSVIPVSGYVLWPLTPRKFRGIRGAPVVAWAHETSGINVECAPSHLQDLFYEHIGPMMFALQGYAVVATDYAGLGINRTKDGKHIPHQWGASPAAANDIIYAVEASRKAWPDHLSDDFVIVGHSQGGAAAWAAAQRLAWQPVYGFRGTVAANPPTSYSVDILTSSLAFLQIAFLANTAKTIFDDFLVEHWLTPKGFRLLQLYKEVGGCGIVQNELFLNFTSDVITKTWKESWVLQALNDLMQVGGRPIDGPMLVVQGTSDTVVDVDHTTQQVNLTCDTTEADLRYILFHGVEHIPTMFAAQQEILNWVGDRFSGNPTNGRCSRESVQPLRPLAEYSSKVNYYLKIPHFAYEDGL